MSIRTKILITVVSLFALSMSVDFIVQRFIIYPSFIRLEQNEAGENIRRIVNAIDREIFHLDKLCNDWATWNESYDFIETLSEEYIQDNLIDDAFSTNKVNLIYFFRNDGTVVWGKGYDLENESALYLPFLLNRTLSPAHPLIALKATTAGDLSRVSTGIIMTAKGPMLFASRAILRSDATGPSRGVLTMGRLITSDVLASLVNQTRINFQIDYPLKPETIRHEMENRTAFLDENLTYYAQKEKSYINVWSVYSDPMGDAIFSISYHFPREITKKGLNSVRYALIIGFGMTLMVLLILMFFLQWMVVQPIKRLTDHASKMDHDGDYTVRLHFNRRDELGELAKVLNSAAATIAERTNKLKLTNRKLQQISLLDGLTGIANRRHFDEHLQQEWRRAVRRKDELSLILLDIDHFKQYNDKYGHQKGDQCLVAIAAAIVRQVKRPADLAARYGGEEFAVILPDTDAKAAVDVAEKIRRKVFDLQILHENSETANVVTISVGVGCIKPKVEDEISSLIMKTDEALYRAKKSGRNQTIL